MSNLGQAGLAIGGAIVGGIIGGPTGALYGSQLGLLAGTVLFPTQLPGVQGPRLQDGQQTVSQIGAPIPWTFGTMRIGGCIIWASPIREVSDTNTVGGKGAPEQKQTTYSYRRSWAVVLTDNEIAGIRRVWANGKLRLDRTPQGDDEADEDFRTRQVANESFLAQITLYLGTETQMPDPTIESFEGAGNVPAFRGRSYIVFNDVVLLAEDGQRIPAQMDFEVYTDAAVSAANTTEYSNDVLFPWMDTGSSRALPMNPANVHSFTSITEGGKELIHFTNPAGGPWDTVQDAMAAKANQVLGADPTFKASWPYFLGHANGIQLPAQNPAFFKGFLNTMGADSARVRDSETAVLAYNFFDATHFGYQQPGLDANQTLAFYGWATNSGVYACMDRVANYSPAGTSQIAYCIAYPFASLPVPPGWDYWTSWTVISAGWLSSINLLVEVKRLVREPLDPGDDPNATEILGLPDYVILDGRIQKKGAWTYSAGTWKVLAVYAASGNHVDQYPLNPALPLGHADYNVQAFWDAAYNDAVARGTMPAGLTYGVDYPAVTDHGYTRASVGDSVELNPVLVSDIFQAICDRAGSKVNLQADTTQISTVAIAGFIVGTPMPARSAADPLRSLALFDVIESGIELKCVKRGGAPVLTLLEEDLGAHDGQEPVALLSQTRKHPLELPRQVRVRFRDPSNDFDVGQELSPARFDSKSESVVDVDLTAAITPEHAAQVAEILGRDAWVGRSAYTTDVSIRQAELEAADPVLVPADGRLIRMRIQNIIDHLPTLRALQLVQDDDGSYESTAVGTTRAFPPQKMKFYGPVSMILLDLPALNIATDNDAGFYLAAYPQIIGGNFRGATLYRSADDNLYAPVASATAATPVGIIRTPPSSGPTTVIDGENFLTVDMQAGVLTDRDLVDVFAGANAAAIGAPGRWEILQFVEAELLYDRTYRLTMLLRGRRGTEHNVATTVTGDMFVLLSAGTIARVPLNDADVNLSLYYRLPDISRTYQSAPASAFTGRGEALRPFSPVNLQGAAADNAWTFTWVRRDRLATDIDIPLSEATEDYEVEVYKDGVVIRTASIDVKTWTYSPEQQILDFGGLLNEIEIAVYQVSAAVGRSPAARKTFTATVTGPGARSMVIEFGGTFVAGTKFRYELSWTRPASPNVAEQEYTASGTIDSTGMGSIADIVAALATAVDAQWPPDVTVNAVGTTFTAIAVSGAFDGGLVPGVIGATGAGLNNVWVAAAPIQAGVKALYGLDLYTQSNFFAPDTDSAYDPPGVVTNSVNWEVYGMDQDISAGILPFYPLPENGYYSTALIAGGNTSRYIALVEAGPAMLTSSQYIEYNNWGYFESGSGDGFRARVLITMKPGYRLQTPAGGAGSHFSGYKVQLRELRAGQPEYLAGKKQRQRIRFYKPNHFDINGNIVFDADWAAGTSLFIELAGVTYSHVMDSSEAQADYDTDAAFQSVYTDFETQIEGGGLYDCTVITGRIEIERNTAGVAFESSAGQTFPLTYEFTIT